MPPKKSPQSHRSGTNTRPLSLESVIRQNYEPPTRERPKEMSSFMGWNGFILDRGSPEQRLGFARLKSQGDIEAWVMTADVPYQFGLPILSTGRIGCQEVIRKRFDCACCGLRQAQSSPRMSTWGVCSRGCRGSVRRGCVSTLCPGQSRTALFRAWSADIPWEAVVASRETGIRYSIVSIKAQHRRRPVAARCTATASSPRLL